MKLSNQAMGAIMMALQKSLMDQSDVIDMLRQFVIIIDKNEELVVENPPVLRFVDTDEEEKIMPREEDF